MSWMSDFSNCVVDIWNSQLAAVVLSPSVAIFKRNLAKFTFSSFYHAMLCIRGTSHGRVSVCPSQVGVLLIRLNIGLHKQHHTIAQGL